MATDAITVAVTLLSGNAPLVAVVAADSITAGVIPLDTTLPAVGVTHVSTVRRTAVSGQGRKFCTTRVQVTVHAATYPQKRRVLGLVRDAMTGKPGVVNGVQVDAIVVDGEGPDFRHDEAGIDAGSQDFIVTYTE